VHVESDQPFKLALVRWVVDGVGHSRLAPPIPLVVAFVLQSSGEMKAMPAQIAAARSDHGASYVNCPARVSGLSRERRRGGEGGGGGGGGEAAAEAEGR